MSSKADEIKKALKADKKPERKLKRSDFLSAGHTLVNLAVSGRWYGAFAKGYYYWIWGGSDSGKSVMGYTTVAEACNNPAFDDYNIVVDVPEESDLIDLRSMFGNKTADRIMPPQGTPEEPIYSKTSEQFYYNLYNWLTQKKPCLYFLDSETGLDSKQGMEKFKKQKNAYLKGSNKKIAGEMGDGKAIVNSRSMRKMIPLLKENGSILIVLSQSRLAIGPLAQFVPGGQVTSGGESLKFYATAQLWTSQRKKIKKVRKVGSVEKKISVGTLSSVTVKRSRSTGKDRTVPMSIYPSFGIDDLGDCIDFLVSEAHWPIKKGVIEAGEFEFSGYKDKLIKFVEETDSEDQLRKIVAGVWNQIEEEISIKRKPRYK